ncbi:MAG: type II secretion system F family protein [Candidatus Promineifilaceae bacterium]
MLPLIILGGIAMLMIMGSGIALISGSRSTVDERLEEFVGTGEIIDFEPERAIREDNVADRLDKSMANRGFFQKIKARLSKADLKLRVAEYILFQFVSAAVVGILAYFVFGRLLVMGIIGAIFGLFIPGIYVGFIAKKRINAFDNQLSDTLNLWVNALRSGYSVLQGMEAIATELPPPVSVEFERVVQEVRLGLSVSQALGNMLRRVPSEDLDLVITAVNIQREVGGNLAEVLDTISFTIRERVRIKGEIRTLTAQGRLSGWIISFLPLALGLILFAINPEYMSQLWIKEDPIILNFLPCGWIVIGIGMTMMIIGMVAIQKIVDIEV